LGAHGKVRVPSPGRHKHGLEAFAQKGFNREILAELLIGEDLYPGL
jgi:hypothetical protein